MMVCSNAETQKILILMQDILIDLLVLIIIIDCTERKNVRNTKGAARCNHPSTAGDAVEKRRESEPVSSCARANSKNFCRNCRSISVWWLNNKCHSKWEWSFIKETWGIPGWATKTPQWEGNSRFTNFIEKIVQPLINRSKINFPLLLTSKNDRLQRVETYIDTIHNLSSTLGMESSMIITKVHPSLNELCGISKNISDSILAKLNSTVESLEEEKQKRLEKVNIANGFVLIFYFANLIGRI